MNQTALFFYCLIPFILPNQIVPQENARVFLIVKYGEEAATPEIAGDFLDDFAVYLREHVQYFQKQNLKGLIANTPKIAAKLLKDHSPELVLASPGFYFQHYAHSSKSAYPIAQIPRFGTDTERYYLVCHKTAYAGIEQLKSKIVRAPHAVDWAYLTRTVFPREFQPGKFFQLQLSQNLADEIFLMLEKDPGNISESPADALLLDEELKQFFQSDDFVWPELKIIWRSIPLPRDMVIAVGDAWTAKNRNQLLQALTVMRQDSLGNSILQLMQSPGLVPVDIEHLTRTQKHYFEADE